MSDDIHLLIEERQGLCTSPNDELYLWHNKLPILRNRDICALNEVRLTNAIPQIQSKAVLHKALLPMNSLALDIVKQQYHALLDEAAFITHTRQLTWVLTPSPEQTGALPPLVPFYHSHDEWLMTNQFNDNIYTIDLDENIFIPSPHPIDEISTDNISIHFYELVKFI